MSELVSGSWTRPHVSRGRLWLIWAVGLIAYVVGVMQRTWLGVAGLDAAARFHATPAALSGFVVLQLLVYAVLQVPAGVLMDRFGARVLVVAGAVIMAAGQLLLAVATVLPLAIAARRADRATSLTSQNFGRLRRSSAVCEDAKPSAR